MSSKPKVKFIYNFGYGETSFKNSLEKLAHSLKVEIEFVNMCHDNDLIKEYNKSILTVFASRLEPLGLVPLESMSCGTPVLGVAEGGIRETIPNGLCGLLVERDSKLFGLAIENLINNKELWKQLSSNCNKYIKENWNWENSVSNIENQLFKLINKKFN